MRLQFSRNFAPSSDVFPEFDWRPKKGLHQILNGFCPQIRLKTKKKRSTVIWYYVMLAGIRDLLVLPATTLSHRPGANS